MIIYPSPESLEHPPVVSRDQWLVARMELLKEEKEFTRLRDKINAKRRGSTVGPRREELRLPRPKWPANTSRSLRGSQPVVRKAFYVRSRMEGRLRGLVRLTSTIWKAHLFTSSITT